MTQYGLDDDADLLTRRSGVAEVVDPAALGARSGDVSFPGMVTESGDLVVLAVQRKGEELAGDTTLAAGDTLLLQGTWGALEEHLDDPEVLVVDEPDARPAPGCRSARARSARSSCSPRWSSCSRRARCRRPSPGLLAAGAIVLLGVLTIDEAYRGDLVDDGRARRPG